MAEPFSLSLLSLDFADRCELRIGLLKGRGISVALTDGSLLFQGEMGSIDPLWSVLNGAKAAARSELVLLGLAREGSEIDVVAYQRGAGVQLASRFASDGFSELLARVDRRRMGRPEEMASRRFPVLPA